MADILVCSCLRIGLRNAHCNHATVVIYNIFNARCGSLEAESESLPTRRVIDSVKNSQGETFVDFLRSVDMCMVNGRKGRDNYSSGDEDL